MVGNGQLQFLSKVEEEDVVKMHEGGGTVGYLWPHKSVEP